MANIIEVALLTSTKPMSLVSLTELVANESPVPERDAIRDALKLIEARWEDRGAELVCVASGYRLQIRLHYAPWVARLLAEHPRRYSRALLETLALIAYRQPITRAEIEQVRGVSVSPSIMKTLQEREWVRAVGHRELPGRPVLYGTTRQFLDDFGLRRLDDLPPLAKVHNQGPYPSGPP